jgi:hypothetical protein
MKKRWPVLISVLLACGCSSSGGGPASGAGGATGGTTAGATGGAAGAAAAGTGGAAGATGGAAGAAAGTGGSSPVDGGAACPFQGMWKAVQYSCGGGAPQAIPPIVTFNIDIQGTTGDFTQTSTAGAAMCTNSNHGTATCAGDTATFGEGITMCSPANCLSRNQCGAVPDPIVWTFTQATATTLTTVSVDPTPLTTCTDQGMANPVTFYWQQQ